MKEFCQINFVPVVKRRNSENVTKSFVRNASCWLTISQPLLVY